MKKTREGVRKGGRSRRKEIVTGLPLRHFFLYYIVGCPPGFFLDTSTKHCRECDIGSYQDTEGQVRCQSCPSGYTTKSKNSDSVDDCYRVKAVGDEGKKGSFCFLFVS